MLLSDGVGQSRYTLVQDEGVCEHWDRYNPSSWVKSEDYVGKISKSTAIRHVPPPGQIGCVSNSSIKSTLVPPFPDIDQGVDDDPADGDKSQEPQNHLQHCLLLQVHERERDSDNSKEKHAQHVRVAAGRA